jgi:circadian locomoter output cycle kaput protein
MTIYDMVYEEDQSDIYSILLNPIVVADPLQNGITPGQLKISLTK